MAKKRPHLSNFWAHDFLYFKVTKKCSPFLVPLMKMPEYSQSSRENSTPSSGTSPVANYYEVPPPPPRENTVFLFYLCTVIEETINDAHGTGKWHDAKIKENKLALITDRNPIGSQRSQQNRLQAAPIFSYSPPRVERKKFACTPGPTSTPSFCTSFIFCSFLDGL